MKPCFDLEWPRTKSGAVLLMKNVGISLRKQEEKNILEFFSDGKVRGAE